MKHTRMRRSSRNTGPDKATRDLVFSRDGDRCAACGTTFQLTIQHRKNRSVGGGNGVESLLSMCNTCNGALESLDEFAMTGRRYGWKLASWIDPASVPVFYRYDGWYSLTSDGRRVPTAAPERAA